MKTTLLTRLGVVVIGAGLILMNTVIPAQAKTTVQSRGIGMSHNISTTGKALNWWAGAFLTDKGLGFCLQPTRLLPKGTELDDIKPMTSFVNDQGDALTTAQLNQLAYLMWKATSTDLQYNIDAVGYKLAMMTLAGYNHVKVNDGNGKLSSTYYNFSLDDSASTATKIAEAYGVLDFARGLVAEARAKANNWDGTGTLKLGAAPQQPGDELTATVTLLGLGSGFPVVFSVTQPDGSVKDVTVDTKSDVATLTETIDQYGDYKVSAHLAHLAAPRYPMVALTMTNTQSLLMMAGDPRDWSSEESGTMTAPKPSISTQISDQIILPGETIHDTVLLEDLITNPHATYVISGGLYALDPLADGTCPTPESPDWDSAHKLAKIENVKVAKDDIHQDGTATLKVGEWTVPMEQGAVCLSYGESVTMLWDKEPAVTIKHPAGDPDQTGLVLDVPSIATHISVDVATPGVTLTDKIVLSGLDTTGKATYSFQGQLLGIPAVPNKACPGQGDAAWTKGTVLATITGVVTPDAITPQGQATQSGLGAWQVPSQASALCVSYAETVTMTVDGHEPLLIDHPAGHPDQTAVTTPVLIQAGGHTAGSPLWLGAISVALLAASACGLAAVRRHHVG